MDLSPDTNKEYVWCAKLNKTNKVHQWGGQDDGSLEQIVLKKACLGVGAVENERNIIQVTSFNHKAEKVEVCICSLRAGLKEDETLSDLTILPPAVFKLVAGSGPVHIVANHMTLSDYLASDDESDMSEDLSNDEMIEEEEEEEEAVKAIKSLAKAQKKAEASVDDDEDDEDDDDYEDMEDDEEDDDDDNDEFEDEISEEEPEVKPITKKRKAEEISKVNGDGKKKRNDENSATPKKTDQKKTPKKEPKTPLQQKENKTPVSAKKTPKSYSSVAELLAAIKKYPGGKPKKEDKFSNWVKHTFKIDNDVWIKKLWKAHKADLGQ